jgi:hypothetical protein
VEDKLFETLDNLDISDTNLLLAKDIKLSVDLATKDRIEKSLMKKTGFYSEKSERKNKINNIIGGIFMKKKIALALSAAVVLSLAGGGYAYAKTPVAYVSVDINPSVELGVNAFDTVVSVEAYNEDGKNVLEGTDLLNTKIDQAVSTVISNAIEDGYIKEDGSSVIGITTSTDKTTGAAVELDESLKNVVDETLTNNDVQAEVQTENVALARRDEARKLGITPGKLNLIQKLQALDPAITVEEYKNSSVKDIQKKTKELRKNSDSETTTEDSTSTSITTGISDVSVTNDTTANVSTEAAISSETTGDSNKAAIVETEEINNSSNNKANNGNIKKEENNTNSKKEEKISINQEEKFPETVVEKQNKNEKANAQGTNNNSSSEEKNSAIKTDSNSSSLKSENSNKGNSSKPDNGSSSSNSQGKGKNK